MKEKKIIYVVVKVDANLDHPCFYIYSKQSSNREKMLEYKKEIAKKYPDYQVGLLSREKAKSEEKRFVEWFHRNDEIRDRKLREQLRNTPLFDSTFCTKMTDGVHCCSISKRISKTIGLFY